MQIPNPINEGFHINIADFDDLLVSWSLFPSIHFGRSGSPGSSGVSGDDSMSSDEEDEFAGLFKSGKSRSGSASAEEDLPGPVLDPLNAVDNLEGISHRTTMLVSLLIWPLLVVICGGIHPNTGLVEAEVAGNIVIEGSIAPVA